MQLYFCLCFYPKEVTGDIFFIYFYNRKAPWKADNIFPAPLAIIFTSSPYTSDAQSPVYCLAELQPSLTHMATDEH